MRSCTIVVDDTTGLVVFEVVASDGSVSRVFDIDVPITTGGYVSHFFSLTI